MIEMILDKHVDKKMLLLKNSELKKDIEFYKNKIHDALEYIYKNSIPIALTVNPPIHKVNFEGDINEVLKILEEENK